MTPPNALSRDQKVLVIAPDPILAALIGVMVEKRRLVAVFPQTGESPEKALERARPVSAVVIDSTVADAASDIFAKRVRNVGARMLALEFPKDLTRLEAELEILNRPASPS